MDGSITIRCPRLPKDTDARVGVRRDNQNPDKKQKVFGYNAILSTSVELHLGIELPVAVSNIAGNADEADFLVENTEQIFDHHDCRLNVAIADSKYDAIKNYKYLRAHGCIPVIDYNPRRENLSKVALISRGYDQNGWPFAPCGLLCKPNGFDEQRGRLSFCCFVQCRSLRPNALKEIEKRYDTKSCPGAKNKCGVVMHMSINDYPRLINEIPRGSRLFREVKRFRSASERSNSSLKEDISILDCPRVLNGKRANILAQMAGIVLLLKRAFSFVVKVTMRLRRFYQNADSSLLKSLLPNNVPAFIRNLFLRE